MAGMWDIVPPDARPGEETPLTIIDREDGPDGRAVCVVPGNLSWQKSDNNFVRLLDEDDIANARLLAAAPQIRSALAALLGWAIRAGHGDDPAVRAARDAAEAAGLTVRP